MTRTRPINFLAGAALVPLVALAVAGCGGDDDSGNAAAVVTPPKTSSGKAATIGVAQTELGKFLVDSRGHTVYLFEKDSGTKSTCFGECASEWPPVGATGTPTVGKGLTASELGTTARSDGKTQLTYGGHPLYLFEGDQKAGDANGQGLNAFGALWYVESPAGSAVTTQSSSSGGGGGY